VTSAEQIQQVRKKYESEQKKWNCAYDETHEEVSAKYGPKARGFVHTLVKSKLSARREPPYLSATQRLRNTQVEQIKSIRWERPKNDAFCNRIR